MPLIFGHSSLISAIPSLSASAICVIAADEPKYFLMLLKTEKSFKNTNHKKAKITNRAIKKSSLSFLFGKMSDKKNIGLVLDFDTFCYLAN